MEQIVFCFSVSSVHLVMKVCMNIWEVPFLSLSFSSITLVNLGVKLLRVPTCAIVTYLSVQFAVLVDCDRI